MLCARALCGHPWPQAESSHPSEGDSCTTFRPPRFARASLDLRPSLRYGLRPLRGIAGIAGSSSAHAGGESLRPKLHRLRLSAAMRARSSPMVRPTHSHDPRSASIRRSVGPYCWSMYRYDRSWSDSLAPCMAIRSTSMANICRARSPVHPEQPHTWAGVSEAAVYPAPFGGRTWASTRTQFSGTS